MDAPKVNLRFELSELLALQQLARKHGTDLGGILRIAALAILELERRGDFHVERVVEGITNHLGRQPRDN